MTSAADQVWQALTDAVLEGIDVSDRSEGEDLVRSIAEGWGANPGDPGWEDVVRIARDDLLERLAAAGELSTIEVLREISLGQRVRSVSSRSLDLAQRFARETTPAAEAQDEAGAIGSEADRLLDEVKALDEESELRRRLMRELADSDLELRYVLDGGEGATSIRLARLLED